MKRIAAVFVMSLLALTAVSAEESWINHEDAPVQVFAEVEGGFLSVISHNIKIGTSGTSFDYVNQGGVRMSCSPSSASPSVPNCTTGTGYPSSTSRLRSTPRSGCRKV
jgi:hypothetical protein